MGKRQVIRPREEVYRSLVGLRRRQACVCSGHLYTTSLDLRFALDRFCEVRFLTSVIISFYICLLFCSILGHIVTVVQFFDVTLHSLDFGHGTRFH